MRVKNCNGRLMMEFSLKRSHFGFQRVPLLIDESVPFAAEGGSLFAREPRKLKKVT